MKSILRLTKLKSITMLTILLFTVGIVFTGGQAVNAASINGSKYIQSIKENYTNNLSLLNLDIKANDKVGSIYALINNSKTYEVKYKSSGLFSSLIAGVKVNDKVTIISYDLDNKKIETLNYVLNSAGNLVSSNATVKALTISTTIKVKSTVSFSALTGKNVDKTALWSSSAPTVASVDKNGNVKALKAGTAVITVKSKDGKNIDSIIVNVNNNGAAAVSNSGDVSTSGITVATTLKVKADLSLKAINSKGQDKTVVWSSSAPNVASVDKNGNVKALKAGTAVITVKSKDGKNSDSITIVVK